MFLESAEVLTVDALNRLFKKDSLGVHIKGFYPRLLADHFTMEFLDHADRVSCTTNSSLLHPTQQDFCKTARQSKESYNGCCSVFLRGICKHFEEFSYRVPICAVLLELMLIWPYGVHVVSRNQKPIWRDLVPSKWISKVAVNVYISVPQEGGVIEISDVGVLQPEDLQHPISNPDIIDRHYLLFDRTKISPQIGDLVLLDSGLIYAVRPYNDVQVTQGCFVGLPGIKEPLIVWF